ncbi:MAG TPA: restriction endonuclease subunit S [Verrucomicrobiae bacterium]|nr:restriction endonuclease subunit S [Verrucomicrobiae bacterium]
MKERLGRLAEIRTGYPFRGRIDRVEDGNCRLVQMGDVRASAGDVTDVAARVNLPEGPGKHVLHYGDVLFVGRGMRNEAATFVAEGGNVIAAPHLFVLRTEGRVAFPDYLTWWLNLPETQEKIRAMRRGSAVPFVPMSNLAALEVPLPSIDMQNHIAGIQRLSLQEQSLMEQIRERRRALVDGLLLEAVRRTTAGSATANH